MGRAGSAQHGFSDNPHAMLIWATVNISDIALSSSSGVDVTMAVVDVQATQISMNQYVPVAASLSGIYIVSSSYDCSLDTSIAHAAALTTQTGMTPAAAWSSDTNIVSGD